MAAAAAGAFASTGLAVTAAPSDTAAVPGELDVRRLRDFRGEGQSPSLRQTASWCNQDFRPTLTPTQRILLE